MVKATFTNLNAEKKAAVTAALLKEFSAHPLADAQVARIVKDAGISRGSFYKYFDDLTDAYQCLFSQAMQDLHTGVGRASTAADIYQTTKDFISQAQNGRYYDLIRLHYIYNEAFLPQHQPRKNLPPRALAAMVISHAAIRESMLDPDNSQIYLDAEKVALEAVLKHNK
ncbi:MAG: TetR/AcrR family transcriptional regulator [Lactobacillus equicursoris]|uniref:TetR/AcrR family transcriptional regulator n=1 Tax=Lactobacillus equicursoris TaxID=420645 RepID=UPI00242E3917|nr:TetR/AcrR family transcriptional regulator [Lactobacillus equicursoris]MDD6407973.1 TetR/AcrR family transcriptional regulator [Lactobacillus equicursoris]